MKAKDMWGNIKSKYSIYFVLIVMFFICWLVNKNFVSITNLSNISRQISVGTILAFGETILIIAGMLDLSSASVLAFSGVLSVSVYLMTGSLLLAFFVGVAVSVVCNIITAMIVTRYNVPTFIATLSMMAMARGAALLYTNGQNIYQIGDYVEFGQGYILGIPTPVIFLAGTLLVTWYLLRHTVFGRSIYAIGGNEEAAIASGINVKANKILAYVINGVYVGVAGVLFMSRNNVGLPNGAVGYEFTALTAAVIGGTSMSGGIGSAAGTVAGAFIVGFLDNIMVLSGVNSYLQEIVRGGIITLAVAYDIYAKSKKTRKKLGSIKA